MIKDFIFDFGQVIVEFKPYNMISPYSSNTEDIELLTEVVFDRIYWDRLDDGSKTEKEIKPLIYERLPKRLHSTASDIIDNWYYHLPVIDGMPMLLKELKKSGKRLYMLSNISSSFAENYSKIPNLTEIFSLFDGFVFSAEIKATKPTAKIFEHITEKYGIDAASCVFIDDSPLNVQGAQKYGIRSVLFNGNSQALSKELVGL